MWVQRKSSGVGGMQKPPPSPVQTAADKMTGGGGGEGGPASGGGPKRSGESPDRSGDARVLDVPLAFAAVQGRPGSERAGGRWEREDVINVDAEPPPPPAPLSAGTSSIRRLRIAAHRTGAVASVLGKRKAAGLARPVGAAAGRWAGERLQCGEWDAWLRDLSACLPGAPPGLFERRLLQFFDRGVEVARDLRQPDFLTLIATALSSLDSGVWESLLHNSTLLKLLMQRVRDEGFSRDLGVVGHIPITADIWERYVPESFASVASRHFSGVGPPSDEAVVTLHALRCQNLLFRLPPGCPGPNGGVFAFAKTLNMCSLIANLVPINRQMPEKTEKFLLLSVEVLALLARVAQQGSSFFLLPFLW